MGYTRAAASDYDDWENVYGNKGWGSQHLIPLLKKVIRVSRSISMEPTLDFFLIGRNIPIGFNEFYPWQIGADQSLARRTTFERRKRFPICR